MRFFLLVLISQLSVLSSSVAQESPIKWTEPCTFTQDGKPFEPKVERDVCKLLLEQKEGARESFNRMIPEEQRQVLRQGARRAEEARLKKEEALKKAAAKQKEKADAGQAKAAALGAADATGKAGKLDTMYTGDDRASAALKTSGPGTALGSAKPAAGGLMDGASRRAESKYAASSSAPPSLSKIGNLKVAELQKRGYTSENLLDLEIGVNAASRATSQLHEKNPSNVAAAYGSGTMTNMEDTAKWAFSGGDYALKRGCISHQQTALAAVPRDGSLDYKPLVVGVGMEHHAVVAYPKGTDWQKTGVVLDGWKNQDSQPEKMTYTIDEWKDQFATLDFIRGTRLETNR